MIIKETMTYVLMSCADDSNKDKIWNYCKKIASYSNVPVNLKEYQRIILFAEDKDIIDVILR